MKTIIKYGNRKMYDKETSKYVNLKEIASMPLGTFKVIEKDTGNDITIDTLLSYLSTETTEETSESKVKVMRHCIELLSV